MYSIVISSVGVAFLSYVGIKIRYLNYKDRRKQEAYDMRTRGQPQSEARGRGQPQLEARGETLQPDAEPNNVFIIRADTDEPIGGASEPPDGSIGGLAGGSIGGLAGGSIGGLAGGSIGGLADGSIGGLAGGSIGGLAGGSIGGLAGGSIGGLAGGSIGGLAGGSIGGLADGSIGGLAGGSRPIGGQSELSVGDRRQRRELIRHRFQNRLPIEFNAEGISFFSRMGLLGKNIVNISI